MRVAIAVVAAALLRCTTAAPPAQPPAQPLAQIAAADSGLRVEVACSTTERRTPVATIEWRGDTARQLEVTPFKDGFERGWYASIAADGAKTFAPSLARIGRDPGRPFAFEVRLRSGGRSDAMIVDVHNLEPGVLYFWRVGDQVVETEAPICPFDEVERP